MSHEPEQVRRPVIRRAGYRQAIRVTWIGLVVIVAQAAIKLLAGAFTHSTALVADGLENVADAGVSVAAIIGLRIAAAPADRRHPYGHGQAEVLTAVLIAGLMLLLAAGTAIVAAWQITRADDLVPPRPLALAFLAATCVVSEGLYRYKLWQSAKLGSAALRAEAADHRKDVFSSVIGLVAVALAVGLIHWTGDRRFGVLDPIGGLITCVFIVSMAVTILRDATGPLMDEAVTGRLPHDVRRLAESVAGVRATEKLLARRSGLNVFVELHVEVDPTMSVRDAHEVATAVRDRVTGELDAVADVVVHIEPYDGDANEGAHRGGH